MQPPSLIGCYALRATRSAEEAVCLSPHLPGSSGPAGLGTSRRVARRRLPRFLRASSLHRSRCELALGLDAKTHHASASRESSYFCALLASDPGEAHVDPGVLVPPEPELAGDLRRQIDTGGVQDLPAELIPAAVVA